MAGKNQYNLLKTYRVREEFLINPKYGEYDESDLYSLWALVLIKMGKVAFSFEEYKEFLPTLFQLPEYPDQRMWQEKSVLVFEIVLDRFPQIQQYWVNFIRALQELGKIQLISGKILTENHEVDTTPLLLSNSDLTKRNYRGMTPGAFADPAPYIQLDPGTSQVIATIGEDLDIADILCMAEDIDEREIEENLAIRDGGAIARKDTDFNAIDSDEEDKRMLSSKEQREILAQIEKKLETCEEQVVKPSVEKVEKSNTSTIKVPFKNQVEERKTQLRLPISGMGRGRTPVIDSVKRTSESKSVDKPKRDNAKIDQIGSRPSSPKAGTDNSSSVRQGKIVRIEEPPKNLITETKAKDVKEDKAANLNKIAKVEIKKDQDNQGENALHNPIKSERVKKILEKVRGTANQNKPINRIDRPRDIGNHLGKQEFDQFTYLKGLKDALEKDYPGYYNQILDEINKNNAGSLIQQIPKILVKVSEYMEKFEGDQVEIALYGYLEGLTENVNSFVVDSALKAQIGIAELLHRIEKAKDSFDRMEKSNKENHRAVTLCYNDIMKSIPLAKPTESLDTRETLKPQTEVYRPTPKDYSKWDIALQDKYVLAQYRDAQEVKLVIDLNLNKTIAEKGFSLKHLGLSNELGNNNYKEYLASVQAAIEAKLIRG